MKLKEKVKNEASVAVNAAKTGAAQLPGAAGLFLWAFWGFLAAGTQLGGGFPLCAAVTAAVSPANGAAAFAGSLAAFFLSGDLGRAVTEIAAMPAIIISKAALAGLFGKRLSPAFSGAHAGAAYLICGVIAAFFGKMSGALILALLFRGALCGGAAYFAVKFLYAAAEDFSFKDGIRVSAAAVYALCICMLCGISLGGFNAGRAAGAFVSAAAAYLFGGGTGAAAAAVSAMAAGTASAAFLGTSPVLICAAAAAGVLRKKGRLAVSAAYICAGLGCCLILGMPSDSPKLMTDMVCAAAVFCFLPDRLCRLPVFRTSAAFSETVRHFGGRLKFAAAAVSEANKNFRKAAEVLDRNESTNEISEEVCGKVCARCRKAAACGDGAYLRAAEDFIEKKGYITEKELPAGLESCPQKNLLAEAFNAAYRKVRLERRLAESAEEMRELTGEYLGFAENALEALSLRSENFPACDEELSARIRGILIKAGAKVPAVSAFFDGEGRLYAECFYEGALRISAEELAEKISAAAERELDVPESFSIGNTTRLCFHEPATFEAEIGSASANGREKTSGDFGAVFRDGFGSVTVLLSDGMGSGARAAVESSMTVSLLTRLLRAGIGAEAALRLINLTLLTKSREECFSTVDMLTVNLFTGKAELIKLGAAQSFIKTNGTVKTAEDRSTPVGIVASAEVNVRTFRLSDGDEAVMFTDGICEDCYLKIRELMMSTGVTAKDCAERIIAAAERDKERDIYRMDDKTVYVLKLHRMQP